MTPLFHLENIVRAYPDPASRDPHAVRTVLNLSELDIRAGEVLGIRGHNGSGKSTLLRIIALLEPPDSGTLLFEGKPAGAGDLHLRRQVTLLLQTPPRFGDVAYHERKVGVCVQACRPQTFGGPFVHGQQLKHDVLQLQHGDPLMRRFHIAGEAKPEAKAALIKSDTPFHVTHKHGDMMLAEDKLLDHITDYLCSSGYPGTRPA